jgi:hypothetical protein
MRKTHDGRADLVQLMSLRASLRRRLDSLTARIAALTAPPRRNQRRSRRNSAGRDSEDAHDYRHR